MKPAGANFCRTWPKLQTNGISSRSSLHLSFFLSPSPDITFTPQIQFYLTFSSTSAGLIFNSYLYICKRPSHFPFTERFFLSRSDNSYTYFKFTPKTPTNTTMRLAIVLLALSTIAAAGPLPPTSSATPEVRAAPSVREVSKV